MDSSSNDKEKLAEIRRKAEQERIQRRQEEYRQKHAPVPEAISQHNRTTPKKWVIVPALLIAFATWYAFSLTAAVITFFVAWVVTLAYLRPAGQEQPEDFDEPEQAEEPQEVVIRFETSVESKVHEIDEPDEPYGEEDSFEQFDYYRSAQLPGTGSYKINYKDQRGLSTERDIRIKRVHKDGDLFAVDAHCYLRNAHRSFVDDRIEYAINIDTGEEVDSVARDAIKQYEESDEGRVVAALDKEWIGVSILVFVCRADGQMRKPERAIVAEYVRKRFPGTPLDDAVLDNQIKAVEEPDQRKFRQLLKRVKESNDSAHFTLLHECAVRIVGTQKTVDPMEKAALEIIRAASPKN